MAASRCWRAARVISTTSPGRCSTRCTGWRSRPSLTVTGDWMMSWINRRELFAAAGGVFAAWLTRRRAAAAARIPPAPVARVAVVKDTYFGETLSDPYRWMENDKDPDWLPFLTGQTEHTRALPERIANTDDANPQWLADGSGFFYNQLTGAVDTPERYLDSQARFHKLGADPESDPILMKRGLDPRVQYERIQMPYVVVHEGSRHALLLLADVREETRIYIAPVADAAANRARWTAVAGFEDEITDTAIDGDTLYLLANKGHPRGRILSTAASAPSVASASEVVPEGSMVIHGIARARDGLYLHMIDGGLGKLRRLTRDAQVADITLPFDGTLTGLAVTASEDGALFSFTGWLTAADIWSVDARGRVTPTGLTPKPPIDVSPYETTRFMVKARDGTPIPCSLIYRKGLKRDGSTPAWTSAYGSYGISAYTPAFAGRTLALIDAGFIVGYANVRGGGEYGRDWHKAGQLANKPNTWRDLIYVCEELCARKYTSRARLAIGGRSAGGRTVGRGITAHPGLLAAGSGGVGWAKPMC